MDLNTIIKYLIDFISSFMAKTAPMAEEPPKPTPQQFKATPQSSAVINWEDPGCLVSKFFTVHEMIYLPTWKRMANAQDGLNDEIKSNLVELGKKMDVVREYFGSSINVHVTYRPEAYNKAIGGALHSAHSEGKAMDFDIKGKTCDEVRKALVDNNLLDTWNMRCEDTPGSNWVHLDYRAPINKRFFKP